MTDAAHRIAVIAAAVATGALVVKVSFCRSVDLPPKPPRPAPKQIAVAKVSAAVDVDPKVFADHVAADSHTFRVEPPATPETLSVVFPFHSDPTRRVLEPGGHQATADVLGLHLALITGTVESQPGAQMVLSIENTTDRYLAYRVVTRPSQGTRPCFEKVDIAHNAVALAPGEKLRRTECVFRSGWRLFVDRVETVELPPLSYYYVSQVPPVELGLDLLSARGHRPAGGATACQLFHSAQLDAALRAGSTTWRDLVDFYARHSCRYYSFPNGYRAFDKPGERPLPAATTAP